ncbi:hypothetical protein ACFWM3_23750 [Gottfriedia sp. NPDC058432]|nr:hypothetical protein [Bacillus sp. FJAT-25509]
MWRKDGTHSIRNPKNFKITGIGESIYRDVENKKGGRREELE